MFDYIFTQETGTIYIDRYSTTYARYSANQHLSENHNQPINQRDWVSI